MPEVDWAHLFAFSMAPLELFLRGTLTYLFLFCLFRFVVHRDVGSLNVSDMLVLVIIADASQNAMAGEYKSLSDGAVLIGTIIGWSLLLDYLSFYVPFLRRFIVPRTVLIVRAGVKLERNLRRQKITDDELDEMLREHEIDRISEVEKAYLEPDGKITVVRKK